MAKRHHSGHREGHMSCIILYRINGGPVEALCKTSADDMGQLFEFPHLDDAVAYAERNALFQSGQADYQIVELNEL